MLQGVVQRGHHIRRVVVQGPVAQFLAVIGDQACSVEDLQIPPTMLMTSSRLSWLAASAGKRSAIQSTASSTSSTTGMADSSRRRTAEPTATRAMAATRTVPNVRKSQITA
ncbi:MAG: hypothetical protein Ct9H300mP31_17640 [Acidimicrobiaceae bacterium]|nr:MAG: hypothetical protein Ct9H300mP31_17640 [Acidimicrobiaceae bacterium]